MLQDNFRAILGINYGIAAAAAAAGEMAFNSEWPHG